MPEVDLEPGASSSRTAPASSHRSQMSMAQMSRAQMSRARRSRPGRERGRRPVRIDVRHIFPDYLAPLALSLPGKARGEGLLDLAVHDLRRWTTRPSPHRRRHALRRRRRDGDEARALGSGARRGRAGRTIVFTTPSASRSPRRSPRAERPRPPRLRLRSLRGDRPAGHRTRLDRRRVARGQPR